MAYEDPQKQAQYAKAWYWQNREKIRAQRKLKRAEKLAQERERSTRKNRAAGAKERPKGLARLPERQIPPSRKWSLIDGQIYFTSLRGFTAAEVKEILAQIKHNQTFHTPPTPPPDAQFPAEAKKKANPAKKKPTTTKGTAKPKSKSPAGK